MKTWSDSIFDDPYFGRCMKMENSLLQMQVSLQFGPRILYTALKGHENLLYNDPEKKPLMDSEGTDPFILYGGHRLWAAPEEAPKTYYPDNNPVAYEILDTGIRFTAPEEKSNGIQKSFSVSLKENAVQINHSIKNCSSRSIGLAPWAITQLSPSGIMVWPVDYPDSGYLPNRLLAFWPYSDLQDRRLYLDNKILLLKQDPAVEKAFKIGTVNPRRWGGYWVGEQLLIVKTDKVPVNSQVDYGCNYEAYVNHLYLEMETLGGFQTLAPGETVQHNETWIIHEKETDIPPGDWDAVIVKCREISG